MNIAGDVPCILIVNIQVSLCFNSVVYLFFSLSFVLLLILLVERCFKTMILLILSYASISPRNFFIFELHFLNCRCHYTPLHYFKVKMMEKE